MTWDHPRGYEPLRAFGGGVDWDVQSLEDFEARPLRELAETYDLVVMDHPGLGAALAGGALLPLDEIFSPEDLTAWETASVGSTWASYTMGGHQWALPIDAATQVGAYRPDRLAAPPATWGDVARTVRDVPSALCLGGPHAMLTLVALTGHEIEALELLREMWPYVDQEVSLRNPIAVHDALADGRVAYCPLVYGYDAYGKLAWTDAPTWTPGGLPLSVLGGTGLAVTSHAADRLDEVRAWTRAFMDPAVQLGPVPRHGGQPAHPGYWTDPPDMLTESTLTSTSSRRHVRRPGNTLTHARIRPRYDGWIAVQNAGSAVVRDCVTGGITPRQPLARIDDLRRQES
jgi:multiple sugar transport system substrate-binding protein